MDKEKRIRELENLVKHHQYLYYNDQPEISDEEFDKLWDELRSLDPKNPLFQKVGEDHTEGFEKREHLIPMNSQDKASNPEAFIKWAVKVNHPKYIVQHKLDGASLELQYERGRFTYGITRGNGIMGDNVTKNVKKMQGCILSITPEFTGGIRGEVVMTRSTHREKYNDKANTRNAANGIMKRKDGKGSEDLKIICYDAFHTETAFFQKEEDKLLWLAEQGFFVVEHKEFNNPDDVIKYRNEIMDIRKEYDVEIDGLVVKGSIINIEDMKRSRPEKQIAFKFSPEEAVSVLKGVEWSESGSAYTPIGLIEPVHLAGTTVKRANLCNPKMIEDMDLRIGSKIVITKRGEIIPKIEDVIENPGDAVKIEYPRKCIVCGNELINEETRLYCPNPKCERKNLYRIEKWLNVLGIKEFGGVLLRKLFNSGRVQEIADLYTLKESDITVFERMGEGIAQKALRNLYSVKEISLSKFIAGFNIEGIGELIAEKVIQEGFDTLEKIRKASVYELSSVEGIGESTAEVLKEGVELLNSEMENVLDTGRISIIHPGEGKLAGRSFCFTGTLNKMKRSDAEDLVVQEGGMVKNAVTKDLDYLVTNNPESGSSKNKKANNWNIPIINEEEFYQMIQD